MARAPPLQGGGRGFDSHRLHSGTTTAKRPAWLTAWSGGVDPTRRSTRTGSRAAPRRIASVYSPRRAPPRAHGGASCGVPRSCLYRWSDVYTSGMALSIKNPEADQLARELAATTGETLTDAVLIALRERLDRERRHRHQGIASRLRRLAEDTTSLSVRDRRHPDEIIGYDEDGLPA